MSGRAEIFDLGYQGYDGDRTSRWRRRRAIWRDGIRISFGLGRGAGAKAAPWILIAFALVPALILVVLAAFLGSIPTNADDFELPSYADYYDFAIISLALFSAVIAPLLVCPDRRDGVLTLYAARPITPGDYVGSRWAAFFTVAFAVAAIPEAILFVWNLLDAHDTGSWLRDNWDIVPRFVAVAALVAVVFTTLALFVSSFTTRRAYASIAMVAVLFIGAAIGGIAHNNFDGALAKTLAEADLMRTLRDSAHWLFGDAAIESGYAPGWASVLWLLGLAAVLGALLVRRTDRMARG